MYRLSLKQLKFEHLRDIYGKNPFQWQLNVERETLRAHLSRLPVTLIIWYLIKELAMHDSDYRSPGRFYCQQRVPKLALRIVLRRVDRKGPGASTSGWSCTPTYPYDLRGPQGCLQMKESKVNRDSALVHQQKPKISILVRLSWAVQD